MSKKTVFLIVLASLSACKKSEKSQTSDSNQAVSLTPIKNDRLVTHLGANPETLNPIIASDAYASQVFPYVFDSLLSWNYQTVEPEGRIAESWKVSADGRTYDFKIRSNVVFHDGKPLTAEDVKFTFDRIKDPKVDAAHLKNYYEPLESVEVISPTEIRFHMKEIYFRNLLMLGSPEILPKHIYGSGDFNKHPAGRAPVGSGPYKFTKWETGRSIELKRFSNYWGNAVPEWKDRFNFSEILMRVITESAVTVMAMKKGDIDELEPTTSQWVNDFADPTYEKKYYKLKFSTNDGNGYGYIGWNLNLPKFSSPKIRRALAMALPREEINTKIFKGLRTLSIGTFPQGSDKSDPSLKPLAYDLTKAKEMMAEEGWKDSNGDQILDKNGEKFSFELLYTAGVPDNDRLALVYQQSLKSLGVELTIKTLEWTVFMKQRNEGKFDAVFLAWGGSLESDPYQIWHSSQAVKGGSNYIGYKNNRVDEILTEARRTLDRPKRTKLYQEFSRIIMDDQPYLFIFERPYLFLADRRFEGVLPVGKLGLDSTRWFTPLGREKYHPAAQ